MITQIPTQKAKAYLYTRPRRFGKSLNLSMLDAFFNMGYPKDNQWFHGLKVSKHTEFDVHRNAYPVIMFDFKELSVDSIEVFDNQFVLAISNLYSKYRYILESGTVGEEDKAYFRDVLGKRMGIAELRKALAKLAMMLHIHHGTKVIILLDEYDNPIHNSFGRSHQEHILHVMRDFLSSALKNRESFLKSGVITGSLPEIINTSLWHEILDVGDSCQRHPF